MLLLIAEIKTLTEDVFIFPETPYTPIIICTPLLLQAEWTTVSLMRTEGLRYLKFFQGPYRESNPELQPTVTPLVPECHVLSTIQGKYDRKTNTRTYLIGGWAEQRASLVAVVHRKTFTHSRNRTAAS